jgi:hypothetical protein
MFEEESETEETPQKSAVRQNLPLLVVLAAIFGGLILLCLFAYLLLGPALNGDSAETNPTPTPFSAADNARLDTGFVQVNIPGKEDPVVIQQESPSFLGIGNQEYSVQIDVIGQDGNWAPSLADEGTTSWVYGTVINYLFGIADTQINRSVMESLQPGDEIQIATKNGSVFNYTFNSREITSRTDREVFLQSTPGLTIVLLGTDGDDRMVIRGAYASAESDPETGDSSGGNVELGEPAALGQQQVTVLGATQLYDQPNAPAGFTFFVVDHQLENNSSETVDTSRLNIVLRDDLGNQYAPSPLATQLGSYAPLTGAVSAGDTVQASVGYALPNGLTASSVYWVMRDNLTAEEVTITIPYAGSSTSDQNAAIVLSAADVSEDGTSLVLQGQLTNTGSEALIVTESDVSLVSDGTVYLLLSTNPAFPWVTPPGETLIYFVSFQRPAGSEAVFTVLNQSYLLTGLR